MFYQITHHKMDDFKEVLEMDDDFPDLYEGEVKTMIGIMNLILLMTFQILTLINVLYFKKRTSSLFQSSRNTLKRD